jgi:hypothetical protein
MSHMSIEDHDKTDLLNDASGEKDDTSWSHIPLVSIVIDTVPREEVPSLTPQMQQTTSLPEIAFLLHDIFVDLEPSSHQ